MKLNQLFENSKQLDMSQDSDSVVDVINEIEEICEVAYKGNIGIMELSAFYQKATEKQKQDLQRLIANKDVDAVWELVYNVTGMKIMR